MDGDVDAAVRRVVDALGAPGAPDMLGTRVAGADLTSFLLEVMRRRAGAVTAADLVRRVPPTVSSNPGPSTRAALHRVTAAALDAIPRDFELLELSPVSPLGTHSAVATVHQHKVVSTIRGNEVAADPTNMLAVLSAVRRRADPAVDTVRLGAVQRVLRAQPMGSTGQAHFSILGLVTAGRDRGNLAFERDALIEQLGALTGAIGAVTTAPIEVTITSLRDEFTDALIDGAQSAFAAVSVQSDPDRASGRGYYLDLCFKLHLRTDAGLIEIGDGGFTDWTRQLTASKKERLLVSGLGLDRLATVAER